MREVLDFLYKTFSKDMVYPEYSGLQGLLKVVETKKYREIELELLAIKSRYRPQIDKLSEEISKIRLLETKELNQLSDKIRKEFIDGSN